MQVAFIRIIPVIYLLFTSFSANGQEWKNMKQYRNVTGQDKLAEGHWLKYDRKHNNARWQQANKYNLTIEDCDKKYTVFAQKRDFYKWIDETRKSKGHEVMWAGVAHHITRRMVVVDNGLIRTVFIGNKEFVRFLRQSNLLILKNICSDLGEMCNGMEPLKGEAANRWDSAIIHKEQCIVLDTLYRRQSPKVLKKFNRMANGKGLYALFVPRKMKMNADIRDCKNRCRYGLTTMVDYYNSKQKN